MYWIDIQTSHAATFPRVVSSRPRAAHMRQDSFWTNEPYNADQYDRDF